MEKDGVQSLGDNSQRLLNLAKTVNTIQHSFSHFIDLESETWKSEVVLFATDVELTCGQIQSRTQALNEIACPLRSAKPALYEYSLPPNSLTPSHPLSL